MPGAYTSQIYSGNVARPLSQSGALIPRAFYTAHDVKDAAGIRHVTSDSPADFVWQWARFGALKYDSLIVMDGFDATWQTQPGLTCMSVVGSLL